MAKTFVGTYKIRTTSFHPASNGMIERIHRQIQDSLKARSNTTNWSDDLPFVLLGIRTTIKEELNCSPANLVYGQAFTVPGELLVRSSSIVPSNPTDVVQTLRQQMRNLTATAPRKSNASSYIPKDLNTCNYVFVRIDRVRKGLEPPYKGTFEIVRRTRKYYVINMNGKNSSISVDRLKPAYTINDVDT